MFADLGVSDAVWLALIGVLAMAVKEYFDERRARRSAEMVAEVAKKQDVAAEKVVEVKEALEQTAVRHEVNLNALHNEFNGLNEKLMEKTKAEGKAEGIVEGREAQKAETAKEQPS